MAANPTPPILENAPPCCALVFPSPDRWLATAKRAIEINPANAPDPEQLKVAFPDLVWTPELLAVWTARYWGRAGVLLTVGFLDNPGADLRARFLAHMNAWGGGYRSWPGANVRFVETAQDPQVRIARVEVKTSMFWSELGTDILDIPAGQPTMNLGGFTMSTPDPFFSRLVRHETGHTLGFPHEHQRQEIVDRIDLAKAVPYFMKSENWSQDKATSNLEAIPASKLRPASPPDVTSVMCYFLPAEIMKDGVGVPGGNDIDQMDFIGVHGLYPASGDKTVPSLLGVPDDPAYGAFKDKLWLALAHPGPFASPIQLCSSTDGKNWTPNQSSLGKVDSPQTPSLAVFQGNLWVGYTGYGGPLFAQYSADGNTWTPQTYDGWLSATAPSLAFNDKLWMAIISNDYRKYVMVCCISDRTYVTVGGWSYQPPSLAAFLGKLWVAYTTISFNVDRVAIASSADGKNWGAPTWIHDPGRWNPPETAFAPSLAVFQKKLWVAYVDINTGGVVVCSSADGTTWTPATPVHGETTKGSPCLTAFEDKLWVAFLANIPTSDDVVVCSSPDGQAWTRLPFILKDPPSPAT